MIPYLNYPKWLTITAALSLSILTGAHADSVSTVPLQNPHFSDVSGDGKPDSWDSYPGGDGIAVAEGGGVWIEDSSSSKGLGIAQWVPATEGTRYTVTADVAGEGGLFVYMNFLEKKPAQAKKIESMTLKHIR